MTTEAEARAEYGDQAVRTAARHSLWRRGDLRYLLHAGQLEALGRINQAWETGIVRFVINVGRRWGKSYLMAVICAIVMLCRLLWRRGDVTRAELEAMYDPWLVHAITRTRKKARILYAAPTGDMIEEFIAPHFEMLEGHAPDDLVIRLHKGDYVNADGDRVVMKGCEDRKKANRLRGPEADLAIGDEGGFIPILGYVVKSAIGFQLAETLGMCLLPSTPPESPDHPFVKFVEEAQGQGAYYHASTRSAPHITELMLDRMIANVGGPDTVAAQREIEAQIVRDPEIVVLPEFGEHLVGTVEEPEHILPAIIGDMGFVDMTVIAFGYYHFLLDIYVIQREVAGQRMMSDELQEAITQTAIELWGPVLAPKARRKLDGTARERAELSGEGVENFGQISRDTKNKGGRMRTLANRTRIVCKEERLLVDPSCTNIIAHMKFAQWDSSRQSFKRVFDENGNPIHHYDGCATGVYFVRDVDDTSNPYPDLGPSVTEDTHWIPPHLRRKQDRKRRLAERFGKK